MLIFCGFIVMLERQLQESFTNRICHTHQYAICIALLCWICFVGLRLVEVYFSCEWTVLVAEIIGNDCVFLTVSSRYDIHHCNK